MSNTNRNAAESRHLTAITSSCLHLIRSTRFLHYAETMSTSLGRNSIHFFFCFFAIWKHNRYLFPRLSFLSSTCCCHCGTCRTLWPAHLQQERGYHRARLGTFLCSATSFREFSWVCQTTLSAEKWFWRASFCVAFQCQQIKRPVVMRWQEEWVGVEPINHVLLWTWSARFSCLTWNVWF